MTRLMTIWRGEGWLYRVIKKKVTQLWRFIFGNEYIKQKIDLLYLTGELIRFGQLVYAYLLLTFWSEVYLIFI